CVPDICHRSGATGSRRSAPGRRSAGRSDEYAPRPPTPSRWRPPSRQAFPRSCHPKGTSTAPRPASATARSSKQQAEIRPSSRRPAWGQRASVAGRYRSARRPRPSHCRERCEEDPDTVSLTYAAEVLSATHTLPVTGACPMKRNWPAPDTVRASFLDYPLVRLDVQPKRHHERDLACHLSAVLDRLDQRRALGRLHRDQHRLGRDHPQHLDQVVGIEPDLDRLTLVVDLDLVLRLTEVGRVHREAKRALVEREAHAVRLFACDHGHATERRLESLVVDHCDLVVVARDDLLVVRVWTLDQARRDQRLSLAERD